MNNKNKFFSLVLNKALDLIIIPSVLLFFCFLTSDDMSSQTYLRVQRDLTVRKGGSLRGTRSCVG